MGYHSMTAASPNTDRAHGNTATIGIVDAMPPACPADECSATGTCASGGACNYTEVSSSTTLDPMPMVELVPR
jgi:hypothetical protein